MKRIWLLLFFASLAASAAASEDIARPAMSLPSPAPAYPSFARRHEIEGVVQLRIHVLASGSPGEIQVEKSSGNALLDGAALEAAKLAQFRPAQTKSGQNVDSWVVVPYKFILK